MGLVKDMFYAEHPVVQFYEGTPSSNLGSYPGLDSDLACNQNADSDLPEGFSWDKLLNFLTAAQAKGDVSSKNIGDVINVLEKEKKKAEEAEAQRAEQERKAQKAHQRYVQSITNMDLPLDWENVFAGDSRTEDVHAESTSDALVLSLANLGRVDIEYMAQISGFDPKSIILNLKGSIFQNPETWESCWYKGWETKEQYLSGNLLRKREIAAAANEDFDGYFRDNIAAIDNTLPEPLTKDQIYVTLGSPWVPADIIDDFANEVVLRADKEHVRGTVHDPITGAWELPYRWTSRYEAYGTNRVSALHLLESALNSRPVRITDPKVRALDGKEVRVVNEEETLAALEEQKKIIADFEKWVWEDPQRSQRLEEIYQRNFGCVKQRKFDGSFLQFPEMDPSIHLYPYQKNAVARMIMMPNTLLAHDVGAGKTFMMIAAGMELKRMGLSKKNLYVVPNNIVGQWAAMFTKIYPNSQVFTIQPKDFTPQKRQKVLETIRDEDFDAIIMSYSSFGAIPLSRNSKLAALQKDLNEIYSFVEASRSKTRGLSRRLSKIHEQINILREAVQIEASRAIVFDDLGITRLFVDEAHNFKNVPITTNLRGCLGLSTGGSQRCKDMMDKVRFIQSTNGGGGVVFATGTPISNSITDAFIMQKYLQDGELAMLDLQAFDDWVRMFAEAHTGFEIDVDTSTFRMATRLSKFHNLPELTTLLSSIADFYVVDHLSEVPSEVERKDAIVERSLEFEAYLQEISVRTDAIRSMAVERWQDNMLKVTTDGRKAGLDMRLIDPMKLCLGETKVLVCAENIADIYFETQQDRSTQLVFCDISTPKQGFNIYDELKMLLIKLGVNGGEIAFVHDFDAPAARAGLFHRMRSGDVRVLIGSTFKVGMGVNIQDKLVALHHLDVPWRPSDMEQREGRILRPGNQNKKIYIFRYITEGSFDAYSWQLLETKQRFISELLEGSLEQRSMGEVDDVVLDYAEVKAIAIGDERIKERVEAVNELSRLLMLQRKQKSMHDSYHSELLSIPDRRKRLKRQAEGCALDRNRYQSWKQQHPEEWQDTLSNQQKEARAAYRADYRNRLDRAIRDQALAKHELQMSDYRGFGIIVPANTSPNEAFVYLQGNNRYRIKLGTSPKGYLIRIDNFLEKFSAHQEDLEKKISALDLKEQELEMKIVQAEDYTTAIHLIKKKISILDSELGI